MLLGAPQAYAPWQENQMNAQTRNAERAMLPGHTAQPHSVAGCSQSAPSLPAGTVQSPWLAGP